MEKVKTKQERINHLKGGIKRMLADEETFGLVGEDIQRINEWKAQIKVIESS